MYTVTWNNCTVFRLISLFLHGRVGTLISSWTLAKFYGHQFSYPSKIEVTWDILLQSDDRVANIPVKKLSIFSHRSFFALQIVVKVPEVAAYFPLLNRRRHLQLVDLQVQVLHPVSLQNFNKANKNGGRKQEVRFFKWITIWFRRKYIHVYVNVVNTPRTVKSQRCNTAYCLCTGWIFAAKIIKNYFYRF